MSTEALRSSIQRFTAAIIDRTSLGYGTVAVQETVSITAGSQRQYDLATILASNPNTFDYRGSAVTVKVLDTDANSPTHNLYIDASAIVSAGVNDSGTVVLHNHSTMNLSFYIRIDVPHSPNQ